MSERTSEATSRIRREMVEHLYGESLPVVSISVAYVVLTIAMAVHESDPVLYGFAAFGTLWSVVRFVSMRAYARYYRPRDYLRWEHGYAVGSFGFSTCLAATVGYTFVFSDAASQIISSGLLFAYGGGMVARISLVPWICKVNLTIIFILPGAALVVAPDGYTRILLVLLVLMYGGGLMTVGVIYRTIEGYVESQRQLNLLANTDPLTGVPNRSAMKQHVAECLAMQSAHELLAIHFIDLDHFKQINDTHGHIVGDEVLRRVADRLRRVMGPTGFVARYGGDEFIVVQSGITDRLDAGALGQAIVDTLSEPYVIDDDRVEIGASDGVAVAGRRAAGLDALMAASDAALYAAKRGGRGCVNMVEVGAEPLATPTDGLAPV